MRFNAIELLRDLGIPETCPTCQATAWLFQGDTAVGVTYVGCQLCSRSYIRGTAADAFVAQLNEVRVTFYGTRHAAKQMAEWSKLTTAWHTYTADRDAPVYYCNGTGVDPAGEPDEPPF